MYSEQEITFVRKNRRNAMNLIKGDNPKLKKVCKVAGRRQGIKLAHKMQKFFLTIPKAYGLAAPQVGILYRVFLMRFEGTTTACINPIIVSSGHKKLKMKEGCLSHPYTTEKPINIRRSLEITVCYYNLKAEPVNETLTGMKARIFQHEVDHLDGICIVDK